MILQISPNMHQSDDLQKARRATTPGLSRSVALLQMLQMMRMRTDLRYRYINMTKPSYPEQQMSRFILQLLAGKASTALCLLLLIEICLIRTRVAKDGILCWSLEGEACWMKRQGVQI